MKLSCINKKYYEVTIKVIVNNNTLWKVSNVINDYGKSNQLGVYYIEHKFFISIVKLNNCKV